MDAKFQNIQLVVHVGPPKSGSTSIQVNANRQRNVLLAGGTLYPKTGLFQGAHWQFEAAFGSSNISDGGHPAGMTVQSRGSLLRDLAEEVAETRPRQVLISFEGFTAEAVAKVRAALGLPSVKIVYVLRRQDELLESRYAHYLKAGLSKDAPADYLEDWIAAPSGPFDHLGNLRSFAAIEGAEIDPIIMDGKGLVPEFFRRIGHTGFTDRIGPRNESPPPKMLELLRSRMGNDDLNYGPGLSLRLALAKVWPRQEKRSFFTLEQKVRFLERFAADNATVAREFLNRPDGVLFGQPAPQAPVFAGEPITYEEAYQVVSGLWSVHMAEMERMKGQLEAAQAKLTLQRDRRIARKMKREAKVIQMASK